MSKKIGVVIAVLLNKYNEVLIAKRPYGKSFAGYWEFPGGKVEPGENQLDALCRELEEEVNLKLNPYCFEHLHYAEYHRGKNVLTLDFFTAQTEMPDVSGREGQELRWIKIEDLPAYRFPKVNTQVITKLLSKSNEKG